jgi:hypothetical protein
LVFYRGFGSGDQPAIETVALYRISKVPDREKIPALTAKMTVTPPLPTHREVTVIWIFGVVFHAVEH